MPPCTVKELLAHANEVLRSLKLPDVQSRTLRFYITEGVVPPPIGSPKFARYEFRHLESLVLSRALQNQGMKLAQIKSQMIPSQLVRERKADYGENKTSIDLTPRCRLELEDSQNMEEDLRAAEDALKRILSRIAKEQKWSQRG